MNKINRIAAFFAIASIAAACTLQENVPSGESSEVFHYYLNVDKSECKTSLDGNSVLWSKTDKIGVVCWDKENKKYVNAEDAAGECGIVDAESYEPSTRATFDITLKSADYEVVAVAYPYYKTMTAEEYGDTLAINVPIPSTQTAVLNGIPDNAMTMVGTAAGENCNLHTACSIFKFEVTESNVKSVSFSSNNSSEYVAGRAYIFSNCGKWCRKTNYSTNSLTLAPPSGSTVFPVGTYYFVAWPGEYKYGFKISVTNDRGEISERSRTKAFPIERNQKYTNFGSDNNMFFGISGVAGDLASTDGTTATIYGVCTQEDSNILSYGFQLSDDGLAWTDYSGEITKRVTSTPYRNVFTASLTGLSKDAEKYFRSFVRNASTNIVSYGAPVSFQTLVGRTVKLDFYNGQDETLFPLSSPLPSDIGSKSGKYGVGVDVELAVKGDTVKFVTKNAGKGIWLNDGTGSLTLGNSVGDYLKFPVISGKKLEKVTLVTGGVSVTEPSSSYNNQGCPSINLVSGNFVIAGGAEWKPLPCYENKIKVWTLSGTDERQCQMYFNHATNRYIKYLELNYVDAEAEKSEYKFDHVFSSRKGGSGGEGFNNIFNKTITQGNDTCVFYLTAYPAFKYKFSVQEWKGSDSFRVTAGQGLRFGGTAGDYMAFCAVPKYKLTYVKIRGGSKACKYSIVDASGTVISEEQKIDSDNDSTVEFNLTNTTANTEYRLKLGTSEPSAIRELWLTYTLVK